MYSVDVSQADFQQQVIERSQSTPVLVDFWAPWCQPCQVLKPVLEALAEEYKGKFILAKVNVDENQELAAQYQIRGIPSVKLFSQGTVIDEFSAVLPEPQLRQFIEQNLPSPAELKRISAVKLYNGRNHTEVLALLQQAANLDPNNHAINVDQARLLIDLGEFKQAEAKLKALTASEQMSETVQELLIQIDVAEQSADLPDEAVLLQQVENNPNDLKLRLDLANLHTANKRYTDALQQLFTIIKMDRDFADGAARKAVLNIFNLCEDTQWVRSARKQFAALLN